MPVRSFHIEDLLNYGPENHHDDKLLGREDHRQQQESEVIDVDDYQGPLSQTCLPNDEDANDLFERRSKKHQPIPHSEG